MRHYKVGRAVRQNMASASVDSNRFRVRGSDYNGSQIYSGPAETRSHLTVEQPVLGAIIGYSTLVAPFLRRVE